MSVPGEDHYEADGQDTIEGTARVVAVEDGLAWFEPEQTSACGGCHAAKACGVEPGARRLVARRFSLPNDHDFRVGERVVVGIGDRTMVRAALTAYGLPLLTTLGAAVTAQKAFGAGDAISALAAVGGLLAGFVLVRLRSQFMNARGELTPHYLRRVTGPGPGGGCSI